MYDRLWEVHMISLIAVDMDGTLLNNDGQMPAHFMEVFQRLTDSNILFAVASGRQYGNLLERFHEVQDKIIFIAENGALVVFRGKILFSCPIPMRDVLELCDQGRKIPNSAVVVCGQKAAYIEKSSDPNRAGFLEEIEKYYAQRVFVDSFADVDDEILKFTICTFDGAEKFALPSFVRFSDRFSVTVSGKVWLDIARPDGNKGAALMQVQNHFGITREQTMAFGDFLNDVELLQNAKYSYAMANSHPDLFLHANFRTKSNNDDGVMLKIVHMLENQEEYG